MSSSVSNSSASSSTASPASRQQQRDRYVEHQIEKTISLVRWTEVITSLATIATFALAVVLAFCVIDAWVWPMSSMMRLAFLLLLLLGCIGWFIWKTIPLLIYKINPLYAARTIEQAGDGFNNSLLNYLTLKKQPLHRQVRSALQGKAVSDLATTPPEETVDRSGLIRVGIVIVGLVAFALAYKLFSPKDPFQSIQRLTAPFAALAEPSRVRILNIEPGNADVVFGQTVDVSVETEGLKDNETAALVYSSLDGKLVDQVLPLVRDPAAGFSRSAVFKGKLNAGKNGIEQSIEYRIVAGDARSATFRIIVNPKPTLSLRNVRVIPPAYTELPTLNLRRRGDISSIEGTTVQIEAMSNLPIGHAHIQLLRKTDDAFRVIDQVEMKTESGSPSESPAHQSLEGESRAGGTSKSPSSPTASGDGRLVKGQFLMRLDSNHEVPMYTHYRLALQTVDGKRSSDETVFQLETIRDLPPTVQFGSPAEEKTQLPLDQMLPVVVSATDPDFKIRSIELTILHRGTELVQEKLALDHPGAIGKVHGSFAFQPSDYRLRPGDHMILFARAFDNRTSATSGLPNPNVIATKNYEIHIAPPENTDENAPASDSDEKKDSSDDAGAKDNPAEQNRDSESQQNSGDEPNTDENESSDGNTSDSHDDSESSAGDEGSGNGDSDGANDDSESSSDKPGAGGSSDSSQSSDESSDGNSKADGMQNDRSSESNSQKGDANDENTQRDDSQNGATDDHDNQNQSDESTEAADNGSNGSNQADTEAGDDSSEASNGPNSSDESTGDSPESSSDPPKDNSMNDGTSDSESMDSSDEPQKSGSADSQPSDGEGTASGNQASEGASGGNERASSDAGGSSGNQKADSTDEPSSRGSGRESKNQNDPANGDESVSDAVGDDGIATRNQKTNAQTNDGNPAPDSAGEPTEQPAPLDKDAHDGDVFDRVNDFARRHNQENRGQRKSQQQADDQRDGDTRTNDKSPSKRDQVGDDAAIDKNRPDADESASRQQMDDGNEPSRDTASAQDESNSLPERHGETTDQGATKDRAAANDGNRDSAESSEADQSSNETSTADEQNQSESSNSSSEQNGADESSASSEADQTSSSGNGSPDNSSTKGSHGQPSDSQGQLPDGTVQETGDGDPTSEHGGAEAPGESDDRKPSSDERVFNPGGKKPTSDGPLKMPPQLAPEQRAELDNAKRLTDLALEYLADQKHDADPDLLNELNMSQRELDDFIERHEAMRAAAKAGDQQSQQQYERALLSYGLRGNARQLDDQIEADDLRGLQDDGAISRPPSKFAREFLELQRRRARQ